jgi:hypothetical protein
MRRTTVAGTVGGRPSLDTGSLLGRERLLRAPADQPSLELPELRQAVRHRSGEVEYRAGEPVELRDDERVPLTASSARSASCTPGRFKSFAE